MKSPLLIFVVVTGVILLALVILFQVFSLNTLSPFSFSTLFFICLCIAIIYLITFLLLWNFNTKKEAKKIKEESIVAKTLRDAPLGKYTFVESLQLQSYPDRHILYLKRDFHSVIILLGGAEFSEIQSSLAKDCVIEHVSVNEITVHEDETSEIRNMHKLIIPAQKNSVAKIHDGDEEIK